MTLKSTTMLTKPSNQLSIAWKPHAYQKRAIRFLLTNSCGGLFLDPGLGKTGISLAALKLLIKESIVDCGLIIAPLRVCYSVWPKEVAKWKDFNGMTVSILHGKDKEKNFEKDADIYLINPEGLPWLLKHPRFKAKFKNQALFLDESSKFKATNTKRFKLLRPVLPYFGRRYILTGSPAPNGLLDLFGQIYVLDLGAALGQFVTHFRSKYFYPTGFGGYEWKLQEGADKLIQDRIRPLTLRLSAEDYLELPKLIINDVFIDLPDDAWEKYKEMEDELIVAIERRDIVAVSAAVASGKCSQIANGGIYDEDGKAHFVHDLKAQAVAEIVDELNGSPALVAYEYGHDLARLKDALGKNTPHIGGGVTPKRSTQLENDWNAGRLPVLLGQPASIAHGLNIQEAGNHVIWHSLTWNFEFYDQFIKRVLRQGNTHDKVFVHRLIARNTVDELKIQALNRKFRTQNDLFEALNAFLRRKRDNTKYPFTSSQSAGIKGDAHKSETTTQGGTTMANKFATKKTATAEAAPAPVKKVKLWTNNPDWQDQSTGVTTTAGKAQQLKSGKKDEAAPAKATKPAPKAAAKKEAKPAAKKATKPAAAGSRGSALDEKKIKVLIKKHEAREGTKRAELFDALLSSKTIGEARGKVDGLDAGAIRIAEELGLISLS